MLISIDLRSILGPMLAPSWEGLAALGRLGGHLGSILATKVGKKEASKNSQKMCENDIILGFYVLLTQKHDDFFVIHRKKFFNCTQSNTPKNTI